VTLEFHKEFIYNVDIRFQTLDHGVVGFLMGEILVLPDNWFPSHNTVAKCDVVVSKDQIAFHGKMVTLAFARLSPTVPQHQHISIDWKHQLSPKTLKTCPLPVITTFDNLKPGSIIVFPSLFLSDGTFKVIKTTYQWQLSTDQFTIRIRDNHKFQTKNCVLAFKKTGKACIYRLPINKSVEDISHFRVFQTRDRLCILKPKFIPLEETMKFFTVPEQFEYKRLDIEYKS
jgi:hypothetical protein